MGEFMCPGCAGTMEPVGSEIYGCDECGLEMDRLDLEDMYDEMFNF